MDNEKTCRSCLEEQIPKISLYQCYEDISANSQLFKIISIFANIQIEKDDGLPDKICSACFNEVKRTWKFINQLQDSDKALRSVEVLEFSEISTENDCNNDDTKNNIRKNYIPDIFPKNEVKNNVSSSKNDCISDDVKNNVQRNDNSKISLKNHCIKDDVKNSVQKNDEVRDDVETNHDENFDDESSCSHDCCNSTDIDDPENDDCDIKPEENKSKSLLCRTCTLCSKTFDSKYKLKHHVQRAHQFEYKCKYCDKSYPQSLNLKIHMRSHVPDHEKKYPCPDCNTVYSFEYQLRQHSYKHQNEKPFPCPKCKKGCLTADGLKRHMTIHDENYIEFNHKCRVCEKKFRYQSSLNEHMKNHTGERPYLCSQCGKGFRQKGGLEYHVRSHEEIRPFRCNTCGSSFVTQGILKTHIRSHTDERPYVCDICGRAFRRSSDCKFHRRTHLGIKLVQCSICKKRMSTTGQLTVHMRVHTGERPFCCSFCLKSFSTRTVLTKHIRTHTGEKPYNCNICKKSFSQSSTLKTHQKTQHSLAKAKVKEEIKIIDHVIIRKPD